MLDLQEIWQQSVGRACDNDTREGESAASKLPALTSNALELRLKRLQKKPPSAFHGQTFLVTICAVLKRTNKECKNISTTSLSCDLRHALVRGRTTFFGTCCACNMWTRVPLRRPLTSTARLSYPAPVLGAHAGQSEMVLLLPMVAKEQQRECDGRGMCLQHLGYPVQLVHNTVNKSVEWMSVGTKALKEVDNVTDPQSGTIVLSGEHPQLPRIVRAGAHAGSITPVKNVTLNGCRQDLALSAQEGYHKLQSIADIDSRLVQDPILYLLHPFPDTLVAK